MVNVQIIVFLSLLLDLFAFTIPLPLFPRLVEWYTLRESSDPSAFLSRTLRFVSHARRFIYQPESHPQRWDVVLLGGLMGSVFSTLQFLVSPKIGSLSDKYGRKRVLLVSMIGNILSAVVWIQSTTFASYMVSRIIGGLSEGNVQLAIAILSDVTTPDNRAKALAHVGIAFAICFCTGPPIGAYFATRPLPSFLEPWQTALNVYAAPAILTLILLLAETIFLVIFLPETRGRINGNIEKVKAANTDRDDNMTTPKRKHSVERRIQMLETLRRFHFLFLGIFSGMEFTLSFLTFDLLDWNNKQNGILIGSIGIISALLQGGYVRRVMSSTGEGVMARRGVLSCAVGLSLLAIFPQCVSTKPALAIKFLQGGAVCLAFTSATVVNALTALASLQCDEGGFDRVTGKPIEEHRLLMKGRALGKFRSSGQLGRAIGPLLACSIYWTLGPSYAYGLSALGMFALSAKMERIVAS